MDSIEVFWKKENKRKQLDNFKNVIDDKFYADSLNSINEDFHYDFLNEMFNSQRFDLTKRALMQHFGDDIVCVEEQSIGETPIICVKFKDDIDVAQYCNLTKGQKNEKFEHFAQAWNYFVTKIDDKEHIAVLEAAYPKKLSKEEREEYGNVFYHVTHSSNVQSIMREGLKCMHQADRVYPKRVHMCTFKDMLGYKVKLMKVATEVLEDPMNAVAIKINMNSLKSINVYKDTVMDDKDYCFYTYDPIAPKYLSIVNLDMKNHYKLKKVNV